MANAVKPLFGAETTLTFTSANSLASSTSGAGAQSTMVDNSTNRYKRIRLFIKIALNASSAATANTSVKIYALRGDQNGTPLRTDNAAASDAALNPIVNAQLIGVLLVKPTTAAADTLAGDFILEDPGVEWGIAIVHDTGFALAASGHLFRYMGENDEIQ
jgi:hypothetical protein